MSQYLERMKLGDAIEVKGPLGHFVYEGRGAYRNSGAGGRAKTMSMIAGGTGITPMFQIIKARRCSAPLSCSAAQQSLGQSSQPAWCRTAVAAVRCTAPAHGGGVHPCDVCVGRLGLALVVCSASTKAALWGSGWRQPHMLSTHKAREQSSAGPSKLRACWLYARRPS